MGFYIFTLAVWIVVGTASLIEVDRLKPYELHHNSLLALGWLSVFNIMIVLTQMFPL